MSAANPLSDSALHTVPERIDDVCEESLPTQPWHEPPIPPDAPNALGTELEGGSELGSFDFHDTIPAPPWLDEPADALELAVFPAP